MTTTTYVTRDGRTVDASEALDAQGNLRNGFGIRVPLTMQDAMQRDIAADAKRRSKTQHRDPQGREAGTSEEEEEEEEERRRKQDAAVGFTDARGVYFPPDQRFAAAQNVLDRRDGRAEGLKQHGWTVVPLLIRHASKPSAKCKMHGRMPKRLLARTRTKLTAKALHAPLTAHLGRW